MYNLLQHYSNLGRQAFRKEAKEPLRGNKGDIKFQSFQMSRNPAFPFLQFSEDTKKQTYDTQLTHQIKSPWTLFNK